MSRQLAPLTRRVVSIPHRAGLLAPGSKRSSSCLPIRIRTVAGSLLDKRMNCSPVTVARETAPDLHRLPYSASSRGHPMRTMIVFLGVVYAGRFADVNKQLQQCSPETRLIYTKCIMGASFMRGGASTTHDPLVANCQTKRDSAILSFLKCVCLLLLH
jgi:hypothetical protein